MWIGGSWHPDSPTVQGMRFPRLAGLDRFLAVHRRIVATLAAMLSVGALAVIATGRDETSVTVVTAAHRLEAGRTVVAADLQLTTVPAAVVPEGALTSQAEGIDRLTAATVPRGGIVTTDSLAAGDHATRSGRLVLPIRLTQPELAGLLRPGTAISLIVADGYGQTTVVNDAVVVRLPEPEAAGLLGGSSATAVLVDVAEQSATLLAGSNVNVTIALR